MEKLQSQFIESQHNHIPLFKYTAWVCIASGFVSNWQTFEDFGSKVQRNKFMRH